MILCWYFDFVLLFFYLYWQKLKVLLQFEKIILVLIVFGVVLYYLGNLGLVEILVKCCVMYWYLFWQVWCEGVMLCFLFGYLFNLLVVLCLCLVVGVILVLIDILFNWIWCDGYVGDSVVVLVLFGVMLDVVDVVVVIGVLDVKE